MPENNNTQTSPSPEGSQDPVAPAIHPATPADNPATATATPDVATAEPGATPPTKSKTGLTIALVIGGIGALIIIGFVVLMIVIALSSKDKTKTNDSSSSKSSTQTESDNKSTDTTDYDSTESTSNSSNESQETVATGVLKDDIIKGIAKSESQKQGRTGDFNIRIISTKWRGTHDGVRVEEWRVKIDGVESVFYITLTPASDGGTDFTISR